MNKNKQKPGSDSIFTLGILSFILYIVIDKRFIEIPDVAAYIWMAISIVLIIIGTFRTAKKLGTYLKR